MIVTEASTSDQTQATNQLPADNAEGSVTRRPGITQFQVISLFGLPFVLLGIWLTIGKVTFHQMQRTPKDIAVHPDLNGPHLYRTNCARCHGQTGNADGDSSSNVNPPARKFGEDRFRLATTMNGAPTDSDLTYIVRHGIPGSAMPGFGDLTEEQVQSLVASVRRLSLNGARQRIIRKHDVDIVEATELAEKALTPGQAVEVPAQFPPTTQEAITRGRATFAKNCATCHGPEGRGDGLNVKDMKTEEGVPTNPRDLTAGVFKGGDTAERLYIRIAIGMPGTPMPASASLTQAELCDLVHFVRSLSEAKVSR